MKITVGRSVTKWDDDTPYIPCGMTEYERREESKKLMKPCHNEDFIVEVCYTSGRVYRKRVQFMVISIVARRDGAVIRMNRRHLKNFLKRVSGALELCGLKYENRHGDEVPVRIYYGNRLYENLRDLYEKFRAEKEAKRSWIDGKRHRW